MRSAAALTLPVALAGAASVHPFEKWSYQPDKTADWYRDNGKPLPELAPEVTSVRDGQSYMVKLACLGCPYEVHPLGVPWQESAEDNALLLNFTIDASNSLESTLLLNGAAIAPYLSLPLPIVAPQVPANLSKETMGKMVDQHMLDASFGAATKYGEFKLQYVHTLLATQEPTEEWVQFDVTGAYVRDNRPISAKLDREDQKLVQVLLKQGISDGSHTLSIKDIRAVARKDRVQPLRMKCGKLAMLQTEFNPLEWDSYGQFGTWSRTWHILLSASARFMLHEGPLILLAAALYYAAKCFIAHARSRSRAQVEDDAEAALLVSDYDGAPPEYVEDEDKEEKEVEQ